MKSKKRGAWRAAGERVAFGSAAGPVSAALGQEGSCNEALQVSAVKKQSRSGTAARHGGGKMKRTLSSVSGAAIIFSALSGVSAANAQQASSPPVTPPVDTVGMSQDTAAQQTATPAPPDETDRVVVTGSLIATAPEDAPKPVQVFTLDDIAEQGATTAADFIRTLTLSTEALSDTAGGGFANANLRGVGFSGTLTLQNGRRTAATEGFFGTDLNSIPVEAMAAVEILKDGASALYGAGAVGGVINYRTRRDVNAPILSVERTMYSGNDGAYKIDFLTGNRTATSNFLLSLSYSHEDDLPRSEKDWGNYPFEVNPAQYQLLAANPGRFHTATNFLGGGTLASGTVVPGATTTSAAINDYRTASDCTALGGFIISTTQPGNTNTGCGTPLSSTIGYFGDQTIQRGYVEFNSDFSDTMEFHFDLGYTHNENFSFQAPSPQPIAPNRGVINIGANCAASCFAVVPVQVNVYDALGRITPTAVTNPFIGDFISRTGATLAPTGALYTSSQWRPFGFGGNPLFPNGGRSGEEGHGTVRQVREQWSANAGLKGSFGEDTLFGISSPLNGIEYDFNAQYLQYTNQRTSHDYYVSRMQNALLGYGGPGCNAVDRLPTDYSSAQAYNRTVGVQSDTAPGTNGCQWFNPFASAYPTGVLVNGAANPQFNAGAPVLASNATARPTGYQNPVDLIDWLTASLDPWNLYDSITIDGLLTGELPEVVELPGGRISWAAGTQWSVRSITSNYENDNDAEEQMAFAQCPWPDPAVVTNPVQPAQQPGQLGCLAGGASGAFFSGTQVALTGYEPPAYNDSQVLSLFGELQLPVLDNLNFSLAGRRENYNAGKIVADIYSVAGKWEPIDGLYVRGSYGTNLRAEGALDLDPGATESTAVTVARFGSSFQTTSISRVADGIGPEDDVTMNIGIGYEGSFGEHDFRIAADFFEININGQVLTTPTAIVFENIFGANTAASQSNRGVAGIPNTGTVSSTNQFANCNASLISFVTFNAACTQGVTTAANLASVTQSQQNGPYFITNGIDYQIDWSHPLWDGQISAAINATNTLVYKQGGYSVNNIPFDPGGDRLGWDNLSRTGDLSTEWRANASLRWSNRVHTVNGRATWISGLRSESFITGSGLTPINNTPGAVVYSTFGVGAGDRADYIAYDLSYIYRPDDFFGIKDLEGRVSVVNITDEAPMEAQVAAGYYVGLGNPRGRMVKLELTKEF